MIVFVPLFFVASEYGQIALGQHPRPGQPAAAVLLRRFRRRRPVRRPHARPDRRPPPRRARRRARRRRAAPVGRPRHHAVRRRRRSRSSCSPAPAWACCSGRRTPTRSTTRRRNVLRRGHRHHADRAQLRLEPRPGRDRRDPARRICAPTSPTRWSTAGVPAGRGAPRRRRHRAAEPAPRGHGDPGLRPGRLRRRDRQRADCAVVGDGGDRRRRLRSGCRVAAGTARTSPSSRRPPCRS